MIALLSPAKTLMMQLRCTVSYPPRHSGERLSDTLAADLMADGSNVIVNPASREHWRVIEAAPPRGVRIITVNLGEPAHDGPRFVSLNANRARGVAARSMYGHPLTDPEALIGFAEDPFDADGSDDDTVRVRRA